MHLFYEMYANLYSSADEMSDYIFVREMEVYIMTRQSVIELTIVLLIVRYPQVTDKFKNVFENQ